MAERRLISFDLLQHPDTAAVLIRQDESLSIMINEEDHLRIQSIVPGMDLVHAAEGCFRTEDALSRYVNFAYDERWGYLTSCPTNTGTGMRASLLMHLPMLTLCKRMGDVGSIAAKAGLTIRGVYGEGQEARGCVYQLSNQVTLGRTEQELIATVNAVGQQLSNMELALRAKSLAERRAATEDTVFRAWGVMNGARLMGLDEFYDQWSAIRLGAAMNLLPVLPGTLDALLPVVQENNLRAYTETRLEGDALKEARATRIRLALASQKPQN